MRNRTAVISGGAQGIGKVTALSLLKKNVGVAVLDNDKEALREFISECGRGAALTGLCCDIADEKDVRRALKAAAKKSGGLDYLVNNAAISAGKPLSKLTLREWNRVIGVNLTGMFLLVKHALPFFRKGKGAIVNIASTRAFMSEPNTEAYSASKGGVFALTHALAMSLGPKIRVNCISPGWIETLSTKKASKREFPRLSEEDHAQHPAGRVGRPEDVAEMVTVLLSGKAGFITGQNFFVDGGMTRKMIYV